jgi:anthranilate phosphoribosyltransferase
VGLSDQGPVESFGGMTAVLEAAIAGRDLSVEVAQALMDEIFSGDVESIQIAGLLTALRAKGETVGELEGLSRSMLEHATRITAPPGAIDIVGTGGDAKSSVNISTMTALVVAAAGVPVAKHGARAASGSVGAADVLEELGVRIDPDPSVVERCIEKVGIGFCFAQSFHPSMKHVAPVRRALGVRTVFNVLGPLANPAQPKYLVLGVADVNLMYKMAEVLGANGVTRAWVVRSQDGYDELSLTAVNDVIEVVGDGAGSFSTSEFTIDPIDHGFSVIEPSDLFGGNAPYNAERTRALLDGEHGAVRDVVLLNAAAALVVAGRARDLGEGVSDAARAIDSGRATNVLDELILESNR